jgi:DUF971 family protein
MSQSSTQPPDAFADISLTEARRLPERQRLRLTWTDGHRAELDYAYLRGWCPCAGCQGHGGRVTYRPPSAAQAESLDLERIEAVGRYALSFLWSDGHGTGIYRFDYLRSLCPCDACREARGGEPQPSL